MNTTACVFVLATLIVLATAENYGQGQSIEGGIGGSIGGGLGGGSRGGPVIAILRDDRTQDPFGIYSFEFESANGIQRQESGTQNEGQMSQGGWRYISPEGVPIELTFVADYNGYQPQGAHIPVAVPLPYQRTQAF